jgi:hypothetical protein
MNAIFWVSISGWAATVGLGTEVLLAYLLRRSPLSVWLGVAAGLSGGSRRRMLPHCVLGSILPVLGLAHGWVPMASGRMGNSNMLGLWLATLALLALAAQALIGGAMASRGGVQVKSLRRLHLAGMLVVSGLVAAHIALNG